MRTRSSSALTELADRVRCAGSDWPAVHREFRFWAARRELRETLRTHLRELPQDRADAMTLRSRETTTHFAWCLRDREDEPFSFWLHEYKPQRDWLPGYADSIHNHRYHFCTTILCGGYVHQRFDTDVDPESGLVTAATLVRGGRCDAGESGYLLADEFHRIPSALDGTMTLLVKSRPVANWSLSFDPATRLGHRHVPVESRLGELAHRM